MIQEETKYLEKEQAEIHNQVSKDFRNCNDQVRNVKQMKQLKI